MEKLESEPRVKRGPRHRQPPRTVSVDSKGYAAVVIAKCGVQQQQHKSMHRLSGHLDQTQTKQHSAAAPAAPGLHGRNIQQLN